MEPNNPISQPGDSPVGSDAGAPIEPVDSAPIEPINSPEPELEQTPMQPMPEESPKMTDIIPPPSSDGFPPMDDTSSAPGVAPAQTPPRAKSKKKLLIIAAIALLLVGGAYLWWHGHSKKNTEQNQTASTNTKTTLTIATIWSDFQTDGVYDANHQLTSKGLQQYVNEYTQLHPNIKITLQKDSFSDHHQKLIVADQTGAVPDIFQMNSQWLAVYVPKGIMATPPADVVSDVKANYTNPNSVVVNNKTWAIPTEIDDYVLMYNKNIFAAAGITAPPKTWNELVTDAVKTTKSANNIITQAGFGFSKDDWEINGDPFVGLVESNGGAFIAPDAKSTLINSPQALEVLKAELQLFQKGTTNLNINFYDFSKGNIAMVFTPPWVQHSLRTALGDKFDSTVGLAPLPVFQKPVTVQYGWSMGVMAKSKQQAEAWAFLEWLNTQTQSSTNTTRMGDLLANTINAIPSRKTDMQNEAALKTPFMSAFVGQLPNSVSSPNTPGFDDIRKVLIKELQAAWTSQETPEAALTNATNSINTIISSYK